VATWVYDIASRRSDAEYELVDLRDYPLPHLDEPLAPTMGQHAAPDARELPTRLPVAEKVELRRGHRRASGPSAAR
jgi:hypothetical protein